MVSEKRSWLQQLGQRVITAEDTEQDKLNKSLVMFACGLMGFGAMLWLAIYWAMGIKFSATVPLTYLAVSAACVKCHNAHPLSPKRDFKPNDVMGGIAITIPLE